MSRDSVVGHKREILLFKFRAVYGIQMILGLYFPPNLKRLGDGGGLICFFIIRTPLFLREGSTFLKMGLRGIKDFGFKGGGSKINGGFRPLP